MAAEQDGRQNFYPNDQADLPRPDSTFSPPPLRLEESWAQAYSQDEEDYTSQAGALYAIVSEAQKARLAATIAGGLSQATASVQARILKLLGEADADYGHRVRSAINPLSTAV